MSKLEKAVRAVLAVHDKRQIVEYMDEMDALREALAHAPKVREQPAQQEPVAWRWTESNGQHWFDWRTDWTHHDRAKAMGFAIEYAYTSPPASKPWRGLTLEDKQRVLDGNFGGSRADCMDEAEKILRERNA